MPRPPHKGHDSHRMQKVPEQLHRTLQGVTHGKSLTKRKETLPSNMPIRRIGRKNAGHH